jgi:hypothetical protein
MRRLFTLLVFLVLVSGSAQAALPGLSDVVNARALLSPGTWSRVLRIELGKAGEVYPKSFYGLVFEMASVLWLYSPQEGTQSLSRFIGRTEEEKKRLAELLRTPFPDLRDWKEEEHPAPAKAPEQAPRNACFIESLALLDFRLRHGARTDYASLFTVYYYEDRKVRGHTVLFYEEGDRVFLADPAREKPYVLSKAFASDQRNLATLLVRGYEVANWRELRLDVEGIGQSPGTMVAEGKGELSPAGKSGAAPKAGLRDYRLKLRPKSAG